MLLTWVMQGAPNPCPPARLQAYETEIGFNHRNYMAQDIMRRILRDFFGYEVNFVMNITDVDDKVSPVSLAVLTGPPLTLVQP